MNLSLTLTVLRQLVAVWSNTGMNSDSEQKHTNKALFSLCVLFWKNDLRLPWKCAALFVSIKPHYDFKLNALAGVGMAAC